MRKAEEYLRATIKYAEEDEDEDAEFLWDNGMELLARYAQVEIAVGRRPCNTQGPTIQICFSVTCQWFDIEISGKDDHRSTICCSV